MVPIEYMQYDADVHLDFIVPETLARDYWGFPLDGKKPFRKIATRHLAR